MTDFGALVDRSFMWASKQGISLCMQILHKWATNMAGRQKDKPSGAQVFFEFVRRFCVRGRAPGDKILVSYLFLAQNFTHVSHGVASDGLVSCLSKA